MRLYHATDESVVNSILLDGFDYHKNDSHWLGNGIYFYPDYSLAEWWATNPSKTFGVEIKKPCILSVDLTIDPDRILDLTVLSGYLECLDAYSDFEASALRMLKYGVTHNRKKLRCAFFDYVFDGEIDCIIGTFTHRNQQYLSDKDAKLVNRFRLFNLPFAEKQVCIRKGLIEPTSIIRCR